jgi:hypothetical protein
MTARPVAPVIPSASPGRQPGKPGAGRPMPLASPPGRPDVVYGFGRIDASGRVADRVTSLAKIASKEAPAHYVLRRHVP